MNIKIHGGVVGNAPGKYGLCTDCHRAHITETARNNTRVFCNAFEFEVREPLTFCNRYIRWGEPDEYEFKQIAWVLNTDPKVGKVGFAPPKRSDD